MGAQLGFLYRQLTCKPKPIPRSIRLEGKTAIITGANVGLGLEAAKELAADGLTRLILAARDVSKGENGKRAILEHNCDVHVWELDYESFDSIKSFGERARALDRLDIAILSAGVKYLEYIKSKTGQEAHVQLNHLGTAALSLLLLVPLRATAKSTGAPSRLTIVTSEVHFWTDFAERKASNIIEELDKPSSFKKESMDRYNVSKLLDLLWLRELSTKVGDDIIVNGVFAWSAEEGGHYLADAATRYEQDQGAYISEQVIKKPPNFVLSVEGQETQKRLFQETLSVLSDALTGVDLKTLVN
ncbi:Short chain dehydrogenase yanD [Talaromyces pinophilus]|nr:Short chain dehydrogenase yanD [Talaromyces pinophilus]